MSKLIEAAQAVVDRFVGDGYSPALIKAIWALRDALAEEAEKKCPICECDCRKKGEK